MAHRHRPTIDVLFHLYQEREPEVAHIHLGKKQRVIIFPEGRLNLIPSIIIYIPLRHSTDHLSTILRTLFKMDSINKNWWRIWQNIWATKVQECALSVTSWGFYHVDHTRTCPPKEKIHFSNLHLLPRGIMPTKPLWFQAEEYFTLEKSVLTHLLSDMESWQLWEGPGVGKSSVADPRYIAYNFAPWTMWLTDSTVLQLSVIRKTLLYLWQTQ